MVFRQKNRKRSGRKPSRRRRPVGQTITRQLATPNYPRNNTVSTLVRVRVQLSNSETVKGLTPQVESSTEPFIYYIYAKDQAYAEWTLSLALMQRMAMSIISRTNLIAKPKDTVPALIKYSQFRVNWVKFLAPLQETGGELPYLNKMVFKTSGLQPARVGSFQPTLGRTTSLTLRESTNFWHTYDSVVNYGLYIHHVFDRVFSTIVKTHTTQPVGYLEFKVTSQYIPFNEVKETGDLIYTTPDPTTAAGKEAAALLLMSGITLK